MFWALVATAFRGSWLNKEFSDKIVNFESIYPKITNFYKSQDYKLFISTSEKTYFIGYIL